MLTPPMKMEQIESSEISARKTQTVGNHPKERTQRSEHGESLNSRQKIYVSQTFTKNINLWFCMKHKVKSKIRGPLQLQSDWVQQQHEANDER